MLSKLMNRSHERLLENPLRKDDPNPFNDRGLRTRRGDSFIRGMRISGVGRYSASYGGR